jgi:hypothetical protein
VWSYISLATSLRRNSAPCHKLAFPISLPLSLVSIDLHTTILFSFDTVYPYLAVLFLDTVDDSGVQISNPVLRQIRIGMLLIHYLSTIYGAKCGEIAEWNAGGK